MNAPLQKLLDEARKRVPEITPEDAHALPHTTHIVDVRERDEYDDGALPRATWIPRGLLELRVHDALPHTTTPVLLYCARGTRSLLAARTLLDLGYTDVRSLAGGFEGWKQRGLPIAFQRDRLTPTQRTRYSRHLRLPEIGESGQRALLEARVLLVGAGGLGSPAALYLAAAGVGTLGLVDSDRVDRSNLQRQVLHTDARVGTPKVDSALQTLSALNPDVALRPHHLRLTNENAHDIARDYDLVIDGSDSFRTRYVVSDACVALGIPHIHGAVYRFDGQITTFAPHLDGPCYRCLHPSPPPPELTPDCSQAGVLGVLPGVIGLLQALEAIKIITRIGEPLTGRLLTFDGLTTRLQSIGLPREPTCPGCGSA